MTGFGLALFCMALRPSGQWRDIANTGLRPVMTLSSEIIGVQTLKAGERVATAVAILRAMNSESALSPQDTPTVIRAMRLPVLLF